MDYKMRRQDRKMDDAFGFKIIDDSIFSILSINEDTKAPYQVPLSTVRHGKTIYFHCAGVGKKIDLIKENNEVSMVFVTDVKVPDLYSKKELDNFVKEKNIGKIISSVFTTEYSSTMVNGRALEVTDESEKIFALRLLCEKYIKDKMEYFDLAMEKSLNITAVYKVDIESISSKRNKK